MIDRKITPLKLERVSRGITQVSIFMQTGISNSLISAIERGQFIPSEMHKQKLAAALGVSVEKIFPSKGKK